MQLVGAGGDQGRDVRGLQGLDGGAQGDADPYGGQLLLELADQQCVVRGVLRAVRVASARPAGVLPVQDHGGDHREALDDVGEAVDERRAPGRGLGQLVERLAGLPRADGERDLEGRVALGDELAYATEQALGPGLGEELLGVVGAGPAVEAHVAVGGDGAPRIDGGHLVSPATEVRSRPLDHLLQLALVADDRGDGQHDRVEAPRRTPAHQVLARARGVVVRHTVEAAFVLRAAAVVARQLDNSSAEQPSSRELLLTPQALLRAVPDGPPEQNPRAG
ncbi:hypothetical protein GCM10009664_36680 [Kitasatospora gansuensis]